jgi:hypothetical protein
MPIHLLTDPHALQGRSAGRKLGYGTAGRIAGGHYPFLGIGAVDLEREGRGRVRRRGQRGRGQH